jgi:hypothetical protein
MFIPLSEAFKELRPGGEERDIFYFYKRDPQYPVEVKITRLPPHFDFNKNWHRHQFVEEFSVPLTGEIMIYEEKDGEVISHHINEAILQKHEWIVGIECESTKRVSLLLENKQGARREVNVEFAPKYTEGKNWHTVGNPTGKLVIMLTLKRVPRSILKVDSLAFDVDRESKDYRI